GEIEPGEALQFSDCTIGSGIAKLVAQCTTLEVPLDPESATAGMLELAIARIPARRQSSRTDAFTLLAGGPGQSAIETFPGVASAFRHVMKDQDVILIDQRGTGDSARLDCPQSTDSLSLQFDDDAATLRRLAQECLATFEHDPTLFTTSIAVQDLEIARQALGISQWNLYGISYGTRVALHYLRRYPDAVRTLTLDAVVPPTVALGPDIGPLAQRSLDLIFQRCLESPGCNEAFGDMHGPTMELLDSLENQPRIVSYEDVVSGRLSTMEFTRQHLAIMLRLLSYSSQTAAILPSMLHDAIVNDNFAPLARQVSLQSESLGDSLSTGMHHAIICTEDAPRMNRDEDGLRMNRDEDGLRTHRDEDGLRMHHDGDALRTHRVEDTHQARLDEADEKPNLQSNSYLGEHVVESLLATCSDWPIGRIDADFHDPVASATAPVLILSGGADPITPPSYGEQAAATLGNSRHLVNADQGHMQAPFGCMPVLLAQFLDSVDPQGLDTQCLERLRVAPFFIDANGPLP
ncbi:MAG: alpha/beta fold hydrolase, partial [Granulosicoccus sp.]|nr:alpha/beta fold hydrolase [Granulosicoccus sp.]